MANSGEKSQEMTDGTIRRQPQKSKRTNGEGNDKAGKYGDEVPTDASRRLVRRESILGEPYVDKPENSLEYVGQTGRMLLLQ